MGQDLFLVVMIAVVVIEGLVLQAKYRNYDWKASAAALVNTVIDFTVQVALPITLAAPFFAWASEYRLTTIAISGWVK